MTAMPIPGEALRFVTLRLLWNCNLRCIMCDHPHKAHAAMSEETALRVIAQLEHPVRLAFIGGEPCLWLLRHRRVLDAALQAGHHVHITTNGLLVPRLAALMRALESEPVSIQFSADGVGATYESIRPPAKWGDFTAALDLVLERRRGNPRSSITLGYLLMKSTLADLDAMVELCARKGVDALLLTPALVYETMVARGSIHEDESVFHHLAALRAAVGGAIGKAHALGLTLAYPSLAVEGQDRGRVWTREAPACAPPRRTPLPPQVACTRPWNEIFVNQDGRMVPCCCGTGVGPVIGSLHEGLLETWNSARAQAVRAALLAGEFDPGCRCGANMSVPGKAASPVHFFTRSREAAEAIARES